MSIVELCGWQRPLEDRCFKVFELSSSSHAVLLYPTSVIVAACWAKALEGEAPVVDILRQHFEDLAARWILTRTCLPLKIYYLYMVIYIYV